jgi:hypothetical protein
MPDLEIVIRYNLPDDLTFLKDSMYLKRSVQHHVERMNEVLSDDHTEFFQSMSFISYE